MSNALQIMVIAPFAPPKNAAEAIQVRRILGELDKYAQGQIVTVQPDGASSWMRQDESLVQHLAHFDTQHLALPWHRLTNRVLASHRLRRFHLPDSMMWIRWMSGRVARRVKQVPDIIYSRSYPMSAALLARRLKQRFHTPWIMHLSDPWAESPYGRVHPRQEVLEAACFKDADWITLTTEGQARHYQRKSPAYAEKISVCPNVMPSAEEVKGWLEDAPAPAHGEYLRLVFAGNLYGARSPEPLMAAIELLRKTRPELLARLRVDIYGNAEKDALLQFQRVPDTVHYHGAVSFKQACIAQYAADVVLSIEPEMDHPLAANFLPSKVLECLALGKPILALTPQGSETAILCREGYGWAVSPAQTEALAVTLAKLIEDVPALRKAPAKAPPERYDAAHVAQQLLQHMQRLKGEGAR